MDVAIRHTTDWRFSTLASWLGVTIACAYYSNNHSDLLLQIPVSGAILALLFYVLKAPNSYVNFVAAAYFLLIAILMQLTSTSLIFIHLVMFSAIFSPHFSLPKAIFAIIATILTYSLTHYEAWQGNTPWVMFIVWFFFCTMNWFVSRRIVESLNMHYQSRQNYKELKATQQMMGALHASQERLHISRELHDALGHKLTALSINLDFAKRTAPADMEETLLNCHQLSQEVLEEVRAIVSAQRNDNTLLKQALEGIFALTPQLRCHLSITPTAEQLSQEYALCVIRFCQEMISNTLKHTKANEITFDIQVTTSDEGGILKALAFHNQRENMLPRPGNGLTGLNERVANFKGQYIQEIHDERLLNTLLLPFEKEVIGD